MRRWKGGQGPLGPMHSQRTVHSPAPATLKEPAGHTTAVALVDPAGHAYPALQGPEQALAGAAGPLPNRPGAQRVHTPLPAEDHVPAGHGLARVDSLG